MSQTLAEILLGKALDMSATGRTKPAAGDRYWKGAEDAYYDSAMKADAFRRNEIDSAFEEASSILISVKKQLEKRDKPTLVEKELMHTIDEWHKVHPAPTGEA